MTNQNSRIKDIWLITVIAFFSGQWAADQRDITHQGDLSTYQSKVMCIEFVYINNSPPTDGYRLIVSNNRDEYYDRPSKSANFWEDRPDCISGLDMMPGRQNGTWFAVSKSGKIGGLLNILTPEGPSPNKLGRGHLVVDYVEKNVPAAEYIETLSKKSTDFNPFNLVLLEKSDREEWSLYYYTNSTDTETGSAVLQDGIYGFSNSVLEKPFKKVVQGQEYIGALIKKFGNKENEEQLQEALVNLMRDKSRNMPDPQLTKQGGIAIEGILKEQRSGIFVHSPDINYGTRTTTILTVSANNCCTYTEYTMKEPIDPLRHKWQTACYTFNM